MNFDLKRVRYFYLIVAMLVGFNPDHPALAAGGGSESSESQGDDDKRCTADGSDCIHLESYASDVCGLIERSADENGLDPNFLARLLWKESRFEPGAISPVGAIGIAQFMPGTAEIYDLDDPFNPALAIRKAAWYLDHLRDRFGNIGLAAIAYNGGENRAARFISKRTTLPYETLDYVEAITGHDALSWRDSPPDNGDLKLEIGTDMTFQAACVKLAGDRSLREFTTQPKVFPWGVIVASHPDRSAAARQVSRLNRSLRPVLGNKRVGYVRKKMSGMPRPVYTAQVGYESRREARKFCLKLKRIGGKCIVLKN